MASAVLIAALTRSGNTLWSGMCARRHCQAACHGSAESPSTPIINLPHRDSAIDGAILPARRFEFYRPGVPTLLSLGAVCWRRSCHRFLPTAAPQSVLGRAHLAAENPVDADRVERDDRQDHDAAVVQESQLDERQQCRAEEESPVPHAAHALAAVMRVQFLPANPVAAFAPCKGCVGAGGLPYCTNQPWLTTSDWPVYTLDDAPAKNRTAYATSSVVVNSPSTVSFIMTLRMTSSSEMPSSFACSGICLSTRWVLTNPGQMTFAVTLCSAPSFARTRHSPSSPCLAVT